MKTTKTTKVITIKARKTTKPASAFSMLTAAQKHIVRQRAALYAHTHKNFQSERTPAERKAQSAALRAFDKKHAFLRKYLAA